MSKQKFTERAAQRTRALLARHVSELVGHTMGAAKYNGHGNAMGRQGKAGHAMPKSDADAQSGAHLPQNANGEGCEADLSCTRNYGIVDADG